MLSLLYVDIIPLLWLSITTVANCNTVQNIKARAHCNWFVLYMYSQGDNIQLPI